MAPVAAAADLWSTSRCLASHATVRSPDPWTLCAAAMNLASRTIHGLRRDAKTSTLRKLGSTKVRARGADAEPLGFADALVEIAEHCEIRIAPAVPRKFLLVRLEAAVLRRGVNPRD
jgi:hypothetical protein